MHFKTATAAALLFPVLASAQVGLNVDAETAVRVKFSDTPVMIDIARCESKFRQYTDAGGPLRGGAGGTMIGVYQISEGVHAEYAKSIGMDIYMLDGNLAYAQKLYKEEGTQPWISSFPCWAPVREPAASNGAGSDMSDASSMITMNLSLGMENPQVMLLQKALNAKGYIISPDGPGSPGNETQKFGALTRAAVRKFQCDNLQICDGDEYSTGYGYVGAKTRAALATGAPEAKGTQVVVVNDAYTLDEQAEIEKLQKQIAELTAVLQALLAAKNQQ